MFKLHLNQLPHLWSPSLVLKYGVAMLSSVLNSPRAVQVNIQIMRTFAKLREIISLNKDLARRLDELEKKYDIQFKAVFEAIRELMKPPETKSLSVNKYYLPEGD